MALDDLKSALPGYAADLRRNLEAVVDRSPLPPQRLWGTLLACAVASRSAAVLRSVGSEAGQRLTPEAQEAAKRAASLMAVNNVFFRTRHMLPDPEYGALRAGLRTSVLGEPGVERADFELWSLAVSALNACGECVGSHERALRGAGVDRETVQEGFKIAAVVHAVGTTLEAEAVLRD